MAGRRYTILGDGAAGMTAVETLRRVDPAASITVVSDDPHPTYYRAALTNYLLGELREDQIWAAPPSFYRDHAAERVFARAVRVSTEARTVELASGAPVPYEALLVATGARARPAAFEGASLAGVVSLRTLQDARAIMEHVLAGVAHAVVAGGGPLGLEIAHALRERGAHVTLLVRGDRLMADALDATASDLLVARLRRGGIEVRTDDEVEAALPGAGGRLAAVRTRAGQTLAADMLAVATGVVCNTELLAGSGVALGPRGGIAVDDHMRSSAEGVYAAGDVAERGPRPLQLWEPARRCAEIAATNMAGGDATDAGGTHYFATRLYDLDFAAVGALLAGPDDVELVDLPRSTGTIAYRRLVLRGGRLRGALMIGERSEGVRRRGRLYQRLVDLGVDVGAVAGRLLDPAFDLRGFIETRAIVARPERAPEGRRPADVRGTQRFSAATAIAAQQATLAAAPLGVPLDGGGTAPRGPMLSVGLHLPAAASPPLGRDAAPARLEGAGRSWSLDLEVVSIGRHGTVALDDPRVSSRHAEIVHHEGARYLRDAGSRNGTRVNGDLVTVPHALRDGDTLRVGDTDLVFHGGRPAAPRPAAQTAPDAPSMPALEIRVGPGVGLRFALTAAHVTLGRDPASVVRLDDLSVSRRHAVVEQHDRRWTVTDLHSSHGTTRNGERLAPGVASPLTPGDVLTLGEVWLVFTRDKAAIVSSA
jgi:NADPH-dependent 2,4-dienoyl-CoA reductase/sulfur reductase-like enzyme/pSer/pThr/pTyr-binding forkhead associated (FHA) protein